MTTAKTVSVVLREGAVVYHDERAYLAGETLEVNAVDARALADQGVVEPSK
jgi:hypothetical protein